jgi:hypothetical protein
MKFMERNIRAGKVTPADILNIRELYHNQRYTQRALANMYNVATETIGRIVRNETWREYGGAGTENNPSAAENLHHAALERMAQMNAPASDSAVIQASMAQVAQKLAALEVTQQPPARDGQPIRDPLCTCVSEHDSRTAVDCPATMPTVGR